MNEALLREAQSRQLPNAEFRMSDLRISLDLESAVDGLWCSFAAAYFPDLCAALTSWTGHLRPGGWLALTEVDDLFGHEPLGAQTKRLFEKFARDALVAGYDVHMGHVCGTHFDQVREEFLGCLMRADHKSVAKIHCCIATKPATVAAAC